MPRANDRRARDDAARQEPALSDDGKPALTDDEKLALELLIGSWAKDERGLPFRKYLVDERESRQVIAKLLRSEAPLHRDLRDYLAILFDPNDRDANGWLGGERQLVFRFRKRGRRRDSIRETHIAVSVFVGTHRGLTVDKAIEATAKKYRLSQESIRRVWDKSPGLRSARRPERLLKYWRAKGVIK
jgi:hypothetical protein